MTSGSILTVGLGEKIRGFAVKLWRCAQMIRLVRSCSANIAE